MGKFELNRGFLSYYHENGQKLVYMCKIENGILHALFVSDKSTGHGDMFGSQRLVQLSHSYDVTENRQHPDLPGYQELEQEMKDRGLI